MKSTVIFDQDKKELVKRDDSPDRPYGANKVPKFSSSSRKNVDQMEATMRKARVSVRARSEAPMVGDNLIELIGLGDLSGLKLVVRLMMDVNGESMDRKWPRQIHVFKLTIDAPWLLVAQLENKYKDVQKTEQF
ncbi:putative WRKY transcription factor [Melia azedarach]|uniref:WRKY transcription factor n=1 Tax=Melia azedarach TaxID=155640 RepID=A0ACC1XYB1_MELAZ|nr:putative WRKY transcription factor [Melia azedarach]